MQAALVLERQRGDKCWHTCEICKQEFTGGMAIALARAWLLQVQDSDEDDPVRLAATHNLASALCDDGKYAEAEQMQRAVLAVRHRVLGAEHPDTLTTARNLASCFFEQKKYAEAASMMRGVLAVQQGLLGEDHPETLATARCLAKFVRKQEKHAEADEIERG